MEKEFKVKINYATVVCLCAWWAYTIYLLITTSLYNTSLVLLIGILWAIYTIGLTPYRYVVDRRTVVKKYRLRKAKEVDLMDCETICDPVPRFSEIYNRPHAIEIYTISKKRHCYFPKERVAFVEAVVRANKRIHCTVQDYTDVHRKLEKRLRKEKSKAEKRAARQKESN